MPLRVPAQRRRSQEPGAERPGTAGALPAVPFNQRVRLLVEAVDQADELALAQGLMEARGWAVRRAGREDAPATADGGRVALVVEVRLSGSRRRAEKAACGAVERLARTHQLALWVRDAALLLRPDDPRTEYRVIRRPGAGTGWRDRLARWWAACGGRGAHRLLRLPGGLTREAVERELTERPLGGLTFASDAYELRPAPPETEEEATAAAGRRASSRVRVLPGAAVAAAAVLGWTALDGRGLLWWPLTAAALFCAPGVYFALRDSWFSRNAVWLVPLALPVGWSLVTWLGRLMQAFYLDRFGVPSGSVRSAGDLWPYAAAAEPLGLALGFVLFFTAVAGWLRHVHIAKGDNRLALVALTVLLSAAFAATALLTGVHDADRAAREAASAVHRGHAPAAYFGVRGALMCVVPVGGGPVPVENGPVPAGHAVLSFGASGDWIWLWDPDRSQALSVRREDVQLLPAPAVSGNRRTGCGR
ncbi:hypothetical protein [Actinacidiphila glaucinigra]|uniref:Uncharacterized protein n=1 Tax=Actinacidiphila glaucinigra TaxID=235986 RepID=A0A239LB04_9ACTN|nr:hypothetical protein [Actinacidiphila glaucinigra]SNT27470.1 hypothetical protein SAMN05216252_11910 [Actinacidiphila glaucinigra]